MGYIRPDMFIKNSHDGHSFVGFFISDDFVDAGNVVDIQLGYKFLAPDGENKKRLHNQYFGLPIYPKTLPIAGLLDIDPDNGFVGDGF